MRFPAKRIPAGPTIAGALNFKLTDHAAHALRAPARPIMMPSVTAHWGMDQRLQNRTFMRREWGNPARLDSAARGARPPRTTRRPPAALPGARRSRLSRGRGRGPGPGRSLGGAAAELDGADLAREAQRAQRLLRGGARAHRVRQGAQRAEAPNRARNGARAHRAALRPGPGPARGTDTTCTAHTGRQRGSTAQGQGVSTGGLRHRAPAAHGQGVSTGGLHHRAPIAKGVYSTGRVQHRACTAQRQRRASSRVSTAHTAQTRAEAPVSL
jgi:hypothetical protein